MPFLIPIQDFDDPVDNAATVQGSTLVTAEGTVAKRARANVAGQTVVQATGSVQYSSAGGISTGSTAVTATGRLNNEANVFGAAVCAGSTVLVGAGANVTDASAISYGSTTVQASGSVARAAEFGFTFYVTLIKAALAASGAARTKRYTAQLLADGQAVPISAFRLSEPRESLGTALQVTLATPDVSLVTLAARLDFDIGVWYGGVWHWVRMLSQGRLAGRENTIAFTEQRPSDTVNLSVVDIVGDRFSRAPRVPVLLYDGEEVDPPAEPTQEQMIFLESGGEIVPSVTETPDLSLRKALDYAFVAGCGFDEVRTNIPDFPVSQVEFTMDGGYEAGVRPLLQLFDPLIFPTEDGNTLWVLDTTTSAPAGLPTLELPLSAVVSLQDTMPAREIFDGIIVTYRPDDDGDYYTETLKTETSNAGTFGNEGYTETTVEQRIREYRNSSDPATVLKSMVVSTKTTVEDFEFNVIHRETQADTYDGMGRKTGHKRTVEDRVPEMDGGSLELQETLSETCSISYRQNPLRPREVLQDKVITHTRGLIHVDNDNTYRDEPFKLPAVDAHRNGFVDPDGDQEYQTGPLKTVVESLRATGERTLDVLVVVTDHVSNTVERSSAQPRVADAGFNARSNHQRRTLITVAGTTLAANVLRPGSVESGRRIPTLDLSQMPGSIVLPLARKRLADLNDPPHTLSAQLPDINFALRKGTLVRPHHRSGLFGNYVVVEREINGQLLGSGEQRIQMSLAAKQLK